MRRKISYRIFLSEFLKEKILELIQQYPPEIPNFKRDKLLYILSLIHEIPARNKRSGLSNNGYTNINAVILRSIIYDYKKYIDYLKLHRVIDCDCHFKPGEKSYGFKMMPEYYGEVKPAYIQNPELIRRLKRHKLETQKLCNSYKHLKKWFEDIEIDFNGALAYIRTEYARKVRNPEMRDWDSQRKRYKNQIEQYNSALVNLYYLKDGHISFFVDDTAGRLHTNLTNIQSELRNFITWKGQKLVSIDISNSQPFLSTLLFRPSFYVRGKGNGLRNFTFFTFSELFSLSFPSSFFSTYHNLTYNPDIVLLLW